MCLLVNALQDRVCVCVLEDISNFSDLCARVCVCVLVVCVLESGKEIQHVVRIGTEEEED